MSGPEPTDPNELLGQLASQRGVASSLERTVAEQAARQELDDRTLITRTVTTVYFVSVPLALVVLLVLSFFANTGATAVAAITDILKSVLLPIMTLVLGYYFGRGKP